MEAGNTAARSAQVLLNNQRKKETKSRCGPATGARNSTIMAGGCSTPTLMPKDQLRPVNLLSCQSPRPGALPQMPKSSRLRHGRSRSIRVPTQPPFPRTTPSQCGHSETLCHPLSLLPRSAVGICWGSSPLLPYSDYGNLCIHHPPNKSL